MAVITIQFISDDRIWTSEDIAKVGNMTTLGMIPLQDFEHNAEAGQPSSAYGRKAGRKAGKE